MSEHLNLGPAPRPTTGADLLTRMRTAALADAPERLRLQVEAAFSHATAEVDGADVEPDAAGNLDVPIACPHPAIAIRFRQRLALGQRRDRRFGLFHAGQGCNRRDLVVGQGAGRRDQHGSKRGSAYQEFGRVSHGRQSMRSARPRQGEVPDGVAPGGHEIDSGQAWY